MRRRSGTGESVLEREVAMEPEWVGLSDAVQALRTELLEAMDSATGQRLRFELGAVEMEFAVAATREGSAEAGVKFWVVNAGAKVGATSQATHRVKLSMLAKDVTTDAAPEIFDEEGS